MGPCEARQATARPDVSYQDVLSPKSGCTASGRACANAVMPD
ncbi:hypothetical protein [Oligella sp. MSHR50489EDL]